MVWNLIISSIRRAGQYMSCLWGREDAKPLVSAYLMVLALSHETIPAYMNIGTVKRHTSYTGHTDEVSALAWSPDGTLLASGSDDKTVQVWQDV